MSDRDGSDGEGDPLAGDVANVADFLAALVPILGEGAPLAEVAAYLDEARHREAHLAVLRVALAAQEAARLQAEKMAHPPGKGPGMRPALGR
jgi:hypothetical protein